MTPRCTAAAAYIVLCGCAPLLAGALECERGDTGRNARTDHDHLAIPGDIHCHRVAMYNRPYDFDKGGSTTWLNTKS
jgi:hypothetical protein